LRLREELALKMMRGRKIENMKIHFAASLITMLFVALVANRSGNVDLSKSINSLSLARGTKGINISHNS
jgi:hypothetical protein